MTYHVTHNPDEKRFETKVDNQLAIIEYEREGDSITFTHTQVPKEIENRGVGTELVRIALAHAREEKLRVIPQCPFVAAYIKRHKDEGS